MLILQAEGGNLKSWLGRKTLVPEKRIPAGRAGKDSSVSVIL